MKFRKCPSSLEDKIAALNKSTPEWIDQLVTTEMDRLDAASSNKPIER